MIGIVRTVRRLATAKTTKEERANNVQREEKEFQDRVQPEHRNDNNDKDKLQ